MASSQSNEITPQVVFGRNARQLEAWRESESHRFLLYGGAAGGGKSFWLRWWCVFYLLYLSFKLGIDRAQVMLACEDYPSLSDRQISKIRTEFPNYLGELRTTREGTQEFELATQYGSGRILLRNLDDPSKYLSTEFAGIAVDELTRNNAKTFNFLRLRLRWPGVPRPRFVAGSNPGGKGHGWVQHLWINREFPKELQPLQNEFYFVPARMQDNPFLPESYYQDLLTLPDAMAKAYAEGRWDLFAGQYFDIWSPATMVEREESWDQKPWHTRWISIDWGFEHPACVHWFALGDDGITRTYRELHRNRLSPNNLAGEILRLTGDERITNVYLSPDAFAHRTDELSIAEQIGRVLDLGRLPRPSPADNDRVGGWMLMYQMLRSGQWKIGSSCTELIRFLPIAVRDDKKVEDIAKFDASNGQGGDDAGDCARYGIKSKHGIGAKPIDVQVREAIAKMLPVDKLNPVNPDYTAIAMASLKAQAELSKKAQPVSLVRKRRFGGGFNGWRHIR